jgi:hypothetical protein
VAPNLVPDRAVVDYYIVRYPREVYLAHVGSNTARWGSSREYPGALKKAYAEETGAKPVSP